ncbi:MAG: hypothetical protein RL653_4333 [Pseudomonadota bacterium]|jgi:hypothetical protein
MLASVRRTVLLLLVASSQAFAADKAGPAKLSVPKLDLGFSPLPRADGLKQAPAAVPREVRPEARPDEEGISVVSVAHGRDIARTASGAEPKQVLEAVLLDGRPPTTERFSTVIRVRSVPRVDLLIEVTVIDPWGKSVMWNEGTVSFRGSTRGEQDYVVDWSPTSMRAGGRYTVEVKLDRRTVGSWPLEVRPPVQP